jgi:drug/metabolite transporter (DMT)-like permease
MISLQRRESAMMPAVSSRPAHSHPVLGIALKLVSVLLLASMAACVKFLGSGIPAGMVIFCRGVVSMLVIALFAWWTDGLHLLKTRDWRAHALRSVAGSISMFCWFIALTMIPLAQMTVISFTIPLFLTVLAMIFLAEHIHWYRWTALAIGFAGVLIIVGPQVIGVGGNALGAGIGLTSAILAAFAQMFLRRMSGFEHALTITFYFFMTSTAFAAASTLFVGWPMPTPTQWIVIGLAGLFGSVGQVLMTYSFRYAEASLLAPLDYTSLLFAVAVGYYVFAESPFVTTWIGAPLVIASGAIILWREYAKFRAIRSAGRVVT